MQAPFLVDGGAVPDLRGEGGDRPMTRRGRVVWHRLRSPV